MKLILNKFLALTIFCLFELSLSDYYDPYFDSGSGYNPNEIPNIRLAEKEKRYRQYLTRICQKQNGNRPAYYYNNPNELLTDPYYPNKFFVCNYDINGYTWTPVVYECLSGDVFCQRLQKCILAVKYNDLNCKTAQPQPQNYVDNVPSSLNYEKPDKPYLPIYESNTTQESTEIPPISNINTTISAVPSPSASTIETRRFAIKDYFWNKIRYPFGRKQPQNVESGPISSYYNQQNANNVPDYYRNNEYPRDRNSIYKPPQDPSDYRQFPYDDNNNNYNSRYK